MNVEEISFSKNWVNLQNCLRYSVASANNRSKNARRIYKRNTNFILHYSTEHFFNNDCETF